MENITTRRNAAATLFTALFMAVHFIPDFNCLDVIGPQWIYLGIIGLAIPVYLFFNRGEYSGSIAAILSNKFVIVFAVFVLWAGISVLFAINQDEAFIVLSRFVILLTGIAGLGVLWHPCSHDELFNNMALMFTGMLIIESAQTVNSFFQNLGKMKLDAIILNLAGNYGNKNFLATSLLVKIPMAVYLAFVVKKRLLMILGMIGLVLGSTAIVILNTRTTLIGLGLISLMFIAGQVFSMAGSLNKKIIWRSLLVFFIVVPSGLFIANHFLSREAAKQQNVTGEYGSVTKRLNDVFLDNKQASRLNLWSNGLKSARQHAPWGAGIGNNRVAAMRFDRYYYNDVKFSLHTHNDFLEVFVELGVLGVLLYTALFVILFSRVFRALAKDRSNIWKSLIPLMMLLVYLFDAMLNFPMERSINQTLLVLTILLIIHPNVHTEITSTGVLTSKKNVLSWGFPALSVLLLLPAVYVSYLNFNSMVLQRVVFNDIRDNTGKYSVPLETALTLPDFPNLVLGCIPVNGIKAEYMIENDRPEEALQELNRFPETQKYSSYCDNLRSIIFESKGQADSAYHYAHKAFFDFPRVHPYYKRFLRTCVIRSDTASMGQAFQLICKFRPQGLVVDGYLRAMQDVLKGSDPRLDTLLENSIARYPADSTMLKDTRQLFMRNGWIHSGTAVSTDYASQAVICFKKNDFQKAGELWLKSAENEPNVASHQENIGICYLKLNKFAKAIPYFNKALQLGTGNKNGKTEFLLAISYLGLNDKDNGCKLLQKANKLGYPDASQYQKVYCK